MLGAPIGFWVFCAGVGLASLAAWSLEARAALVALVQAPAQLWAFIAPGETPHEDARQFGGAALFVGSVALGLAAAAPVVVIGLSFLGGGVNTRVRALAERTVQGVEWVIAGIGSSVRWMAPALAAVVAVVVTQRYVFGLAFTKLEEAILYLHAGLFMLIAADTLRVDGHVRVDVLFDRLPGRARALINLLGAYLLLAPMCLVIVVRSERYVDASWRVFEGSWDNNGLALVYLLKTLIPVFAALLLVQGAASALRAALALTAPTPPGPVRHDAETAL